MRKEPKPKKCADKDCQNEFTQRLSTDKYCSPTCFYKNQKNPSKPKKKYIIPKVSAKMSKALYEYGKVKKEFINKPENRICPVTNEPTNQIHHKMGRVGYADNWASQNEVSLLVDIRFFLAVSYNGHKHIEENPIWAKEKGYSIDRLSNKDVG